MNDERLVMAGPCARGSPSRTIEVRSIALNALPFPPVSRVLLLALSLVPSAITAQTRPASSPSAAARPDTPSGAVVPMNGPLDTTQFAALKWREIGPYRGGRSVAVAGSVKRSNEYWMGTTGGGVFKSTDAGMTWLPVTDKYFGGTIGAIAVAPSNPDIVYVGTGEYPIRGNVSHGDGVYKTVDGGKTWTFLGLKETRQISRVRVHPTNPDIVYVGAQGHVWGPNADRGVFRSRDGGKSWQKVLFRNDSTGVSDLVMDPANPNTLYAAFWQAGRTPWLLVSGGPGSGIFKTENGGDTWRNITRNVGLPKGLLGNIGITVSGAKPNRVWAIIEAEDGGVFRSEDGGSSWVRTNDERKLRQRAWYYSKIHADPTDSNVVYVNNVAFNKSTDGGKTFRTVRVPHADSHDLWIAPNDNQRMIEGDDGGASVSVNGGKSWSDEDYATAQFYHVTTTNHFPYRVCGAQQDNSTLCGPSRKEGAIDLRDWDDAGGGESGYIAARTDDPDIVYAGSYGGHLTRKDLRTGIERDINPWPDNPMGHSAIDLKYRFQWTYPIVLSPHDPNTLYAASNVLFRSTNEGQTWTPISGDLTRHDARTLGPSGGPITKDQTSVEYYATIFTVAESPMQKGVIWTGSDDGLIHLTRDAGKSWTNVTPPQLTAFTRISMIEPSRHTPGGAYVAANRYQLDDMQPYIWRTSDYGRTWKRVDDDIAAEEFVRVVREDPERKGLLYAGTERGVWVSFDDGQNWQRLQLNLPPVPVHDLAVKEGDLVAGTHGRSFYILDDLSVLRQATPAVAKKPAHLFKPRRVWRVTWGGGGGGGGGGGATNAAVHPRGANPPSGAVVYYTLDKGGHEVVLDFMDVRGTLIKSFTSKQDSATASDSLKAAGVRQARLDSLRQAGADTTKALEAKGEETTQEDEGPRRAPRPPRVANKAGLNMFVWNLRYADASTFDDMILWAGGTQGPVAPPATYRVRMKVNGTEIATDTFVVRKDPRSRATMADLREQIAFLLKIRDRVSEANDAVKQIRAIKRQLDDRESKATGTSGVSTTVLVRALRETLSMVEDSLYQTKNKSGQDPLNYPIRLNNKLSALSGVVAGTDARPTDQSYGVFNTLSAQLDRELMTMTRALDSLLPKLNVALQQIGLAAIEPKTQPVAGSR